jgi:hypothetical protein
MKKFSAVLALSLLASICVVPSYAADVTQNINCSVFGTFQVTGTTVTGTKDCAGKVVVPNSVTIIGPSAFANNSDITSVEIGNSLQKIERGAFFEANGLTELTIPDNVIDVGSFAISDMRNLKSLTLGGKADYTKAGFSGLYRLENVQFKEGITRIPGDSFKSTSISTLKLPSSITGIGQYAFAGSRKLISLSLPEGLQEIERNAFAGTSLSSIRIPAAVRSIGDKAFAEILTLNSFEVDSANQQYSSDSQGVLYDKNKEILISAPFKRESITIPNSVKKIATGSFGTRLEVVAVAVSSGKLVIPSSVVVIEPELRNWIATWSAANVRNEEIRKAEAERRSAASKKITITCVKGKLTKKVTAVSPKCPTGYKKK